MKQEQRTQKKKTLFNVLEDMEIPRVDLVDLPAVGRKFLLLKNQEVNNMPEEPMDLQEMMKDTEGDSSTTQDVSTHSTTVDDSISNHDVSTHGTDQDSSTPDSVTVEPKEEPVVEEKSIDLSEEEQKKVRDAYNLLSDLGEEKVGKGLLEKLSGLAGKENKYPKSEKEDELEEKLKDVLGKDQAEQILATLHSQEEELAKAAENEKVALEKQVKDAYEQIETLKKSVDQERRKREEREFVDVIQKDIRSLPGQVDENAKLLFSVSEKLEKEEFDKLLDLFKSASSLVQKSGFLEELGSAASESDPENILKARAKEKMEENPSLTLEKAKSLILSEDQDLYRQLRNQEVK